MQKKNDAIFIEFVKEILNRPAMFEVNNVEDLYLVLFGYKSGSSKKNMIIIAEFLISFREYVNRYFENAEDISWHKLIRFNSASDSHTLSLFNELLENFIKQKNL